jgi:hypothetical protein
MRRILFKFCLILIFISCNHSSNPLYTPNRLEVEGFPKIDRRPSPADYSNGVKVAVPEYDQNSTDPFQIDFRSFDLSALNFKNSLNELMYSTFNSRTIWPADDMLPLHFDYTILMELGKNPGLNVRSLHKRNITGKNVGIAIVDQTLLTEHVEYADNLQFYEEINLFNNSIAQMHGAAVASIAVGQSVGVAPEANLFYIATILNGKTLDNGTYSRDFTCYAEAVHRLLEINELLPSDKKIRVISMSAGWSDWEIGYSEIKSVVDEAKSRGIFVVSSNIEEVYGFKFHGLGRFPLSDPDLFESYLPGSWWCEGFYDGYGRPADRLLVPMDSRSTASETGVVDYVF